MSTSLIDRAAGTIHVLSRYPAEGCPTPLHCTLDLTKECADGCGLPHAGKHEVLRVIPAADLFAFLDRNATGFITTGDLSDALVEAFDCGFAEHLGFEAALFDWVGHDGTRIQQHST